MGVGVMLGGFVSMMFRMRVVAMRNVSVVAGFFVVTSFVMLGGFEMMLGRVRVMLSRFFVMFGSSVCHFILLSRLDFDKPPQTW